MIRNIEESIDLLAILRGQGWKEYGGSIRNNAGVCPFCALINEVQWHGIITYLSSAWMANHDMNNPFSEHVVDAITQAADLRNAKHRDHLKYALGML